MLIKLTWYLKVTWRPDHGVTINRLLMMLNELLSKSIWIAGLLLEIISQNNIMLNSKLLLFNTSDIWSNLWGVTSAQRLV
jgi:hypothetical protein